MFHYIPAIGVAHPSDPSCFTERGMPRGTQMHTEKYSSSDVGHTGHGIREAQHAYSNSTSGVAPWPSGSHVGGCETWADFRKTTGDLAMEHGHWSNRNGDLIWFNHETWGLKWIEATKIGEISIYFMFFLTKMISLRLTCHGESPVKNENSGLPRFHGDSCAMESWRFMFHGCLMMFEIWGFPSMGIPQNRWFMWFMMEHPI